VNKMVPNMGGTDLWPVLRSLLLLSDSTITTRNVILVSDGLFSDFQKLLTLLNKVSYLSFVLSLLVLLTSCALFYFNLPQFSRSRIFAFGVGSDVSKYTIKTVARVGGGASEFITSGKYLVIFLSYFKKIDVLIELLCNCKC